MVFSALGWRLEVRGRPDIAISLILSRGIHLRNTTFLIFAVPLLVWPIHVLSRSGVSDRTFLLRIVMGIAAGFAAFVLVRFAVFSGGAVGHRSLIPPLTLVWSYLTNLAWYCIAPFQRLVWDEMSWLWGLAAALVVSLLLVRAATSEPKTQKRSGTPEQSPLYIAALGLGILVLGMLPYLMAGYDSPPGLTSQSRVYSSGAFGLAILLGTALSTSSKLAVLRAKKAVAVVMIAFMGVFLAGLRHGWLDAASDRDKLSAALLKQVPDVAAGTTFLFLDLQSYVSDEGVGRAVVFQGVDGLGEFVKMVYNNKDIYAYFIYSKEDVSDDPKDRKASVSREGVTARGSAVRPPIPLDSLLILKREGTNMVLLDKLTSEERTAAIDWKGVSEIRSNKELILARPRTSGLFIRSMEK